MNSWCYVVSLYLHICKFFAYSRDSSSVLVVSMDLMKSEKVFVAVHLLTEPFICLLCGYYQIAYGKEKDQFMNSFVLTKNELLTYIIYHPPPFIHLECNPGLRRNLRQFSSIFLALPPFSDRISSVNVIIIHIDYVLLSFASVLYACCLRIIL